MTDYRDAMSAIDYGVPYTVPNTRHTHTVHTTHYSQGPPVIRISENA